MEKLLDRLSIVLMLGFCAWLGASLIDVWVHQGMGGTSASWNMFVMMIEYGKEIGRIPI